jgi:hypothetical protein
MSLPGFNADAALYRSNVPYMMSSTFAASGVVGAAEGVAAQALGVVGGDMSFGRGRLVAPAVVTTPVWSATSSTCAADPAATLVRHAARAASVRAG